MKWLGWSVGIFLSLLLVGLIQTMTGLGILGVYLGMLTYTLFKLGYSLKKSLKNTELLVIIAAILNTAGIIITRIIFNKVSAQMDNLSLSGSGSIISFQPTPIVPVITFLILFALTPIILFYFDKKQYDESGFKRSPWLTLIYNIFTLGIYFIYWTYLMKKALAKRNITILSLWYFLIPMVGGIIMIAELAKGFAQITNTKKSTWIIIGIVLSGINVPIMQAKLNTEVKDQTTLS